MTRPQHIDNTKRGENELKTPVTVTIGRDGLTDKNMTQCDSGIDTDGEVGLVSDVETELEITSHLHSSLSTLQKFTKYREDRSGESTLDPNYGNYSFNNGNYTGGGGNISDGTPHGGLKSRTPSISLSKISVGMAALTPALSADNSVSFSQSNTYNYNYSVDPWPIAIGFSNSSRALSQQPQQRTQNVHGNTHGTIVSMQSGRASPESGIGGVPMPVMNFTDSMNRLNVGNTSTNSKKKVTRKRSRTRSVVTRKHKNNGDDENKSGGLKLEAMDKSVTVRSWATSHIKKCGIISVNEKEKEKRENSKGKGKGKNKQKKKSILTLKNVLMNCDTLNLFIIHLIHEFSIEILTSIVETNQFLKIVKEFVKNHIDTINCTTEQKSVLKSFARRTRFLQMANYHNHERNYNSCVVPYSAVIIEVLGNYIEDKQVITQFLNKRKKRQLHTTHTPVNPVNPINPVLNRTNTANNNGNFNSGHTQPPLTKATNSVPSVGSTNTSAVSAVSGVSGVSAASVTTSHPVAMNTSNSNTRSNGGNSSSGAGIVGAGAAGVAGVAGHGIKPINTNTKIKSVLASNSATVSNVPSPSHSRKSSIHSTGVSVAPETPQWMTMQQFVQTNTDLATNASNGNDNQNQNQQHRDFSRLHSSSTLANSPSPPPNNYNGSGYALSTASITGLQLTMFSLMSQTRGNLNVNSNSNGNVNTNGNTNGNANGNDSSEAGNVNINGQTVKAANVVRFASPSSSSIGHMHGSKPNLDLNMSSNSTGNGSIKIIDEQNNENNVDDGNNKNDDEKNWQSNGKDSSLKHVSVPTLNKKRSLKNNLNRVQGPNGENSSNGNNNNNNEELFDIDVEMYKVIASSLNCSNKDVECKLFLQIFKEIGSLLYFKYVKIGSKFEINIGHNLRDSFLKYFENIGTTNYKFTTNVNDFIKIIHYFKLSQQTMNQLLVYSFRRFVKIKDINALRDHVFNRNFID